MPTIEQVRAYYPDDDPVHGFSHILRVFRLCERIGAEEMADLRILRAAALLHDVVGDVGLRVGHHLAAADFASRVLEEEGWAAEEIRAVAHCIRAHRFRDDEENPETLEAKILFDADKLDAIGAVGIARAVAYALRAGMDVYAVPSDQFRITGELAEGESQTVAHEYFYKLRHIKDRLYTKTGRDLAEARHALMVRFFDSWMDEIGGQDSPLDQP